MIIEKKTLLCDQEKNSFSTKKNVMTILAAACNIICGVEPILGYEMTREAYQPGDHFPYKELSILSIVLFSSTLALTGLFPYAGFMVVDLGMAKDIDSAGYYAGYLASAMMFGRLSSSIFWGRVADRIGRKPVLYVGSLSIIVFSLTFGLSLNIWMALGSRFLLGVFNPIVGIGKTLVSEVCSKKHEATGMGIITGQRTNIFIHNIFTLIDRDVEHGNDSWPCCWWLVVTSNVQFPCCVRAQ